MRINRRRRVSRHLTDTQREELVHGFSFTGKPKLIRFDGDDELPAVHDTANMVELRALWIRYRAELMSEDLGPGRRPAGFYWFDLKFKKAPCHWFEELAVLLDHGLIDAVEAVLIDKEGGVLDPNQSPDYCAGFDSPERIRAMGLSVTVLWHQAAEFEAAARWHAYRGRPELAECWAKRAEVVRQMIAESIAVSKQAGARFHG